MVGLKEEKMTEKKQLIDWFGVATLLVLFSFLGGIAVFLWQIYGYLRFEVWRSVSVVDVLRFAEIRWAFLPNDWLGLYRVLDWTPISVFLPLLGVFLAVVAGFQDDSI